MAFNVTEKTIVRHAMNIIESQLAPGILTTVLGFFPLRSPFCRRLFVDNHLKRLSLGSFFDF